MIYKQFGAVFEKKIFTLENSKTRRKILNLMLTKCFLSYSCAVDTMRGEADKMCGAADTMCGAADVMHVRCGG